MRATEYLLTNVASIDQHQLLKYDTFTSSFCRAAINGRHRLLCEKEAELENHLSIPKARFFCHVVN
ncbi:hypothetical protein Dimus_005334, partial [Dionaea muscipula]